MSTEKEPLATLDFSARVNNLKSKGFIYLLPRVSNSSFIDFVAKHLDDNGKHTAIISNIYRYASILTYDALSDITSSLEISIEDVEITDMVYIVVKHVLPYLKYASTDKKLERFDIAEYNGDLIVIAYGDSATLTITQIDEFMSLFV